MLELCHYSYTFVVFLLITGVKEECNIILCLSVLSTQRAGFPQGMMELCFQKLLNGLDWLRNIFFPIRYI